MKILFSLLFPLIFSFSGNANDKGQEEKIADIIREQDERAKMKPLDGFVPTTEVAIQIATAILKPIFKNKLKEELPLSAKKQGNVWFIKGRERTKCSEADKKCFQFDQDPVRVEIDSVDGKILKVVKYK